jgi:hypothetical protein
MLVVLVSLGATGFLLGRGQERFEEIHEVLAWIAVGLAALHVTGIVWHRLRQKECIATSMITGRKEGTHRSVGRRGLRGLGSGYRPNHHAADRSVAADRGTGRRLRGGDRDGRGSR